MRQKIDIAEVESATKIRAKYLRALENEEFGLLPGTTFVKTFMRTYAEYLGLDAQLLIEEYRVDYEPRGETEQPMVSRPSRRQQEQRRRPRPSRGPPGPGTAVVVVVAVVVVILAILGLTADDKKGGAKKATTTATTAKNKPTKTKRKTPAKPKPTSVRLRIVPSSATYLCVDRGQGTSVVYQGTTVDPQTFRGKRLRVNIGNASTVRVSSNGKRVSLPAGATIVGYEFTPTRSKPLPADEPRPCA
ncbi:MAG: cytoskeleton protein RodZ [Thermoleophilaceae bacterium]|nr:cytoskeleton protein RodZ [Thermoleophilaceae bacterium]